MVVTALPDVWGAINLKLKATMAVTALTSDRIADEVKSGWDFVSKGARHAIVIEGPLGGPGEQEMPLYAERYQLRCYGSDRRTARLLARTVRAAMIPPDGGEVGFTYGDCAVTEVAEETAPIYLVDPDTKWCAVVIVYIVSFDGVPVS